MGGRVRDAALEDFFARLVLPFLGEGEVKSGQQAERCCRARTHGFFAALRITVGDESLD